MGRYALWCMNRVTTWRLDGLADGLSLRGWLGGRRHEVKLGDRSAFDSNPSLSKAGVLSHEGPDLDEYFVPIVVKCIGDPEGFERRLGDRLGDFGKRRLHELLAGFGDFFGPNATNPWIQYWRSDGSTERMATATSGPTPHLGFYEILVRRAETDGKAVLVGYSQDGLVARFLAFLDEQLVPPEARVVRGFVTVQAPNSGSPLANPLNAETVARGFFALLAGALAFPVPPPGTNRHLGDALKDLAAGTLGAGSGPPRHFDIVALCALLDAATRDAGASDSHLRFEMLRTARKWLTGLSPERSAATAFGDLDPATLDDPTSVLGLLEDHPIARTHHGAIVGTDNGLFDFVAAGRPAWQRWILREVERATALGDALREAEHAYAQIVMNELEASRPLSGREALVAHDYRNGCGVLGVGGGPIALPAWAHDFVIPSVSHALGPRNVGTNPLPEIFLGNSVNPQATHIGGGDENDPGSDEPLVKEMLRRIGERLP